jgi:hypothetical protein
MKSQRCTYFSVAVCHDHSSMHFMKDECFHVIQVAERVISSGGYIRGLVEHASDTTFLQVCKHKVAL